MNNKIKNNLYGILKILLCWLFVFVITGKIGLSVLITAALFGVAFGIYCLVEWIKEKKKKITN